MKTGLKHRIICGIGAVLALASVLTAMSLTSSALTEPDILRCEHCYVYNLDNDVLLFSRGEADRIAPGPTVKLMTALIAIETYRDRLNEEITVTQDMLSGAYGNRIGLSDGEVVTIEWLLNAMIVGCANDATTVLATLIAGSVEDFAALMNERAVKLGATHTYYTNPTGLDNSEMYTTVEDIALIAEYLSKYSLFAEISAQATYYMPQTNLSEQRKIVNKNYLISTALEYKYYASSVNGMIAGNTTQAGYCVVAQSEYNNSRYLCIVMGATRDDDTIYSYVIARNLLTWAYQNFSYITVLDEADIVAEIPVKYSAGIDYVTLMPKEGVTRYLPSDIDVDAEIRRSWSLTADYLTAPVEAGQKAGELSLVYQGQVLATVDLVTKSAVERSKWLYAKELVASVFRPQWMVPCAIVVVPVSVIWVLKSKEKERRG